MKTSTQHTKILNHLEKVGSISVREGMVEYSIPSLTKRISELRRIGYKIEDQWKKHKVTGQWYKRYYLAS
jgi:hypothetical protein